MMARLLLSFAFAAVAYELYWHLLSRWHGVRPDWFGRSQAEQRLRGGRAGFLRLVVAWTLVLIVYAFGTEKLFHPFTAEWWLGAVGAAECAFIAAFSPLLAAAEWHLLALPVRRSSRIEGAPARMPSVIQNAH